MDTNRSEIIMDEVQRVLAEKKFENNAANRFAILTGIRDAWLEDDDSSVEKSMYMLTINLMIGVERMHLMYQPVKA